MHERELAVVLTDMLTSLNIFSVYNDSQDNGIVLFNSKKLSSDQVYDQLNKYNVCARNGLHCAPLAHKTLGTDKEGAIRFSIGWFNSKKELDNLYKILKNI